MAKCDVYDFEVIKGRVNRSGKLTFDIETTGKTAKDQFIAVGYAWKRRDGTLVRGHCALSVVDPSEMTDIERGDLSWLDVWHRKGFEIRCFTEFWNAKDKSLLHLLRELQRDGSLVTDEAALAKRVNRAILDAEEHWDGNVQIITDTTAYDTCWLHRLLVDHRFQPLDTTRAGRHRWSYDVDSFMLGALGVTPDIVNWSKLASADKLLSRLPVDAVEPTHHPAIDAQSILAKFEAVEVFNAMVPTSTLAVVTASDEEYASRLEDHLCQVRDRIAFMRNLRAQQ